MINIFKFIENMIKEIPYETIFYLVNIFAQKKAKLLNLELDPKISPYMQLSNYLGKRIINKPRKISASKNFKVPRNLLSGYEGLIEKIKNGEDVNMYLSNNINNPMFADRLFDDYGCVHFHLGNELKNRKIKRTGPIALAFVSDNEVFFIEVKDHGSKYPYTWTDKSVLEILHKEKPHFIQKGKISRLKDISAEISKAETIKNLRNNGYSFGVTLDDGTVYMPQNFGQVTVGKYINKNNEEKFITLGSEHSIKMTQTVREIYYCANRYMKKFKLHTNCMITKAEISNLQSDDINPLIIRKFDIKIYFLKGFNFCIQEKTFSKN